LYLPDFCDKPSKAAKPSSLPLVARQHAMPIRFPFFPNQNHRWGLLPLRQFECSHPATEKAICAGGLHAHATRSGLWCWRYEAGVNRADIEGINYKMPNGKRLGD